MKIINKEPKSMDSRGISHIVLPLAVVVLVALVGVGMLVASHAATNTSSSKITVKAYQRQADYKDPNYGTQHCDWRPSKKYSESEKKYKQSMAVWKKSCRVASSGTDLYVRYDAYGKLDGSCYGKSMTDKQVINLGSARTVKCVTKVNKQMTGAYTFFLKGQLTILGQSNPQGKTAAYSALLQDTPKSVKAKLGSQFR